MNEIKNTYIVADFDKTLTKGYVQGRKSSSVISILRDFNYLSDEYAKAASKLYEKYSKVENDMSLTVNYRVEMMRNWWQEHNQLLFKSKLNIKHLNAIVDSRLIEFRDGAQEFFQVLNKENIPFIILSASGIGDVIPMLIEECFGNYANIHYIVNRFNWDENGNAISLKNDVITSLSKSLVNLNQYTNIQSVISNKRRLVLLGDSLDDVEMAKPFKYDVIHKVSYINEDYENNIAEYSKTYDICLHENDKLDIKYIL